MHRFERGSHRLGYTLAELLIVIAIIGVISLISLLLNSRKSMYAGRDVERKTDVVNIHRAFEEYYNDHGCYPPVDILNTCGGNGLSPALDRIPCDPSTKQPYLYQPVDESNLCAGNRLCVKLQDFSDPDITKLGCDPTAGCGWGAYWNYCVAAGTTVTPAGGFVPSATGTPTPTPIATPTPTPTLLGPYACRPGIAVGGFVILSGSCNNVGDPASYGCPNSFAESDCQNKCGQQAYWCAQ